MGARMPRGASGRVVVELDPSIKRQLYNVLTQEGMTLKEWFRREAERHIREHREPSLFNKRHTEERDV
jgi:hypothetical protein